MVAGADADAVVRDSLAGRRPPEVRLRHGCLRTVPGLGVHSAFIQAPLAVLHRCILGQRLSRGARRALGFECCECAGRVLKSIIGHVSIISSLICDSSAYQ
jgi:hypothetical protein